MSKHPDRVNTEYTSLHPDHTPKELSQAIGERCRIAREFWNGLSPHEQARYVAEAEEDYRVQSDEYRKLQDTLAEQTPPTLESQNRYVRSKAFIYSI